MMRARGRARGLGVALGLGLGVPNAQAAPPEEVEAPRIDPFNLENHSDTPPVPERLDNPLSAAPELPAEDEAVVDEATEVEEAPEGPAAPQEEAKSLLESRSADAIALHRHLAPPDGKRMLIAGGTIMGIGFLGQLAGWSTIRRACATATPAAVRTGNFLDAFSCGVGFAGGSALLFFSGIPEFVGAPWIVAGATFKGRNKAFDDHFFGGYAATGGRKTKAFIWGGSGLIAFGALSWLVSPVFAVRSCINAPSLTCSVDATTWGFNLGLGALTAGGALLGYGLAYRKAFTGYKLLSPAVEVQVSPEVSRGQAGLRLSGRF